MVLIVFHRNIDAFTCCHNDVYRVFIVRYGKCDQYCLIVVLVRLHGLEAAVGDDISRFS
jgi:hypothetical protein